MSKMFFLCSFFFWALVLTIMPVMMAPVAANEVIGEVKTINTKINALPLAFSAQDPFSDQDPLLDKIQRPLYPDTGVFVGDRLQVPPEGRLSIRLLDGSQITLGAESDVMLEEFIYSELNQVGSVQLKLVKGSIHFNTGGIRRAPNFPVFLATSLATIRIQAATMWASLTDGGLTIGMLEGLPLLVETDGGRVTLEKPGEVTQITDKASPPSEPYPMGGQQMATIIGNVIDPEILIALVGPDVEPPPTASPDPNADFRPQPRTARQVPAPDSRPMTRPGAPQSLSPDAGP